MPTQPAVLGTARLGNFRLGYESTALAAIRRTRVRILLAGVDVRVRVSGLTIRDLLNEAPNTCSLTIASPPPTNGQALRITINSDTPRLLFNGTIVRDDLTYEGKPTQLAYPCEAIDDTVRLNKRRPFGTWVAVSATTIAQYLVTTYAPGFTSAGIAASLPPVSITFDGTTTFMGCLQQLAALIGGYCNVEDGVVYLFLTDATNAPDPIQSGYPFLNDPPIRASFDESQLRNRVYGKGHAEALLMDVAVGETRIPIADAVMYNAIGGQAIAATTSDGAPSQILSYTALERGGGGSLVGPGAAPTTALIPTLAAGTGLGVGVYKYAFTDVTASGESLPSPLALITTSATGVAAPATAPTWVGFSTGLMTSGAVYLYAVTFVNAIGESIPGPTVSVTMTSPGNLGNDLTIPLGPVGTTERRLYRTAANGAQLKRILTSPVLTNNTVTSLTEGAPDGSLGANAPTSSGAAQQVALSGIAIGPAAVTARKIYRTAVDGTQLKLQQTIANNTVVVGVQDATADGSLGANAPTSDTSGLTQPSGQVLAGATSLIVASTGPFSTAGGWALLPNTQVIRYQGISGGSLVGIPATGPGSITATVSYNSTISVAPMLIGIPGNAAPLTAVPLTLMARVTPTTLPANAVVLALENRVGGAGFYLRLDASSHMRAQEYDGATSVDSTSAGTLTAGVSAHLAATFNGTTNYGYLNGVQATGAAATAAPVGVDTFYTGRLEFDNLFVWDGTITQIAVWSTVLTPAEILSISNGSALPSAVQPGSLLVNLPLGYAVGSIRQALAKGAPVHLWIQRDDLAAQAAAAIRESTATYTSDGIHEHLITDERRGEASLTLLCDADLVRFADPIATVTYATRDVKTKSGKPVVVNLASPAISQTLTIQDVTISEIDIAPGLAPRFSVSASSVRFSLEDLLRRMAVATT